MYYVYIHNIQKILKILCCSFFFTKLLAFIDCLCWVFRPTKAYSPIWTRYNTDKDLQILT